MGLPYEYPSYEGLLTSRQRLSPPLLENALLGTNTLNSTKSKAVETSCKPSLGRIAAADLSQFKFLQLNVFYHVLRKFCKQIHKRNVTKLQKMDKPVPDYQNVEYAINEGDMLRCMSRREKKRAHERQKHRHKRVKEYEEDRPAYLEEDQILAEKQFKPKTREKYRGPPETQSEDMVGNYKLKRQLQLRHLNDALTRVGAITRTLEENFKNPPPNRRKGNNPVHSVETQTRLLEAIRPVTITRKVASCSALVYETKKQPIVKPKTAHDLRRPPPKEETNSGARADLYHPTIQSGSSNFLDKYASRETFKDTPGEAAAIPYAETDEATKACLEFRQTANQVLSRFSKEVNTVLQDCCCSIDDIWDCIRHTLEEIKDVSVSYDVVKADLKCISPIPATPVAVEENKEVDVNALPCVPVQTQSENQVRIAAEAENRREEIENEIEDLPPNEKIKVSNAELNLSLERYLEQRLSSYELSKIQTSNAETNINMTYYPTLVQEQVYVCNIPPTIPVVEDEDIDVTPKSDDNAEPIIISPELQQQLREIATNLDVENLSRTRAQSDIHCRLIKELAATDSLLEFQRKMEYRKPRKRTKKKEPKPAEIIEEPKSPKPTGIIMEELFIPSRKINKIGPCKPRPASDCYKFALYKETRKKKVNLAKPKREKQPVIQLPTKKSRGKVEEKSSKYEGSLWFSKKKGEASSSKAILNCDSTPKFSETRLTSETTLQAQANLNCSVNGQVMNIQSTHQKAGLNCFDILDEISHKDIKPLESEYPRKDHLGTESPHPRVESTYLYRLVYNTAQDDFLKLLRIEQPIIECSALNCHLCKERRCSSIEKEPKEDHEDIPTEKEDKKKAIRKTCESKRLKKPAPVYYNTPVENLHTKLKPEKKKLFEGNKFAPPKWKKKKNSDVLAKLAPYMFDPKMRYPTTITVMPVTVTYFSQPRTPPGQGDCCEITDVKWKRKTSSQDVAAMLSPYMYDPKTRYPTTITAMPTTMTYANPNFVQQKGPLRTPGDEYSNSKKPEYRITDFSKKGMVNKKLWEPRYPKSPAQKLVSYVGKHEEHRRHEEHLEQNEKLEKCERRPRSPPLTTVIPPIRTLKGVPLSKSFDVTHQYPQNNYSLGQPSKSKMKKVMSTLNDHDGNKISSRASSPIPLKTCSKTNARTPRIESPKPKPMKKARILPTLETNIQNVIEMMEGKIVEIIHSPEKQRSGAFEQVEQEIKQILRNLKQDESHPLDVIQEGPVKEPKPKKGKKSRSPSPEDVKKALKKVEEGNFQASSLLLSDISHGSVLTSKSSHNGECFVVTSSYNPGQSRSNSPTRVNSTSELKKGDSSQVSLTVDDQKESVMDSGDAKPTSAEKEVKSTEPDLKLNASDLLKVNAANESIQNEMEEIINNMLDEAILPILAPSQEPPNTETAVVPLKPKLSSETTICDDPNKSTIVLKLKATLPRQKSRRRPNSTESKKGVALKVTTEKSCLTQTYYTKIRITHYKQTNHMPQVFHQAHMFYPTSLLQIVKITGTKPPPLLLDCRSVQLAKHLIAINFRKLGFLFHSTAADIRTVFPNKPAIMCYHPGRMLPMLPYMQHHEIFSEDCSSRENVSRCPRTCVSDIKEHGTFLNSVYGILFTTMFTGLTFNYSCH